MKTFFRNVSPGSAWDDFKKLFFIRRPHQFGFMGVSLAVTLLVLYGFVRDSHFDKTYKREIIYVESWRLDRTDAEIIAQQTVDEAAKQKRLTELRAKREKKRLEMKKIDDALTSWGL